MTRRWAIRVSMLITGLSVLVVFVLPTAQKIDQAASVATNPVLQAGPIEVRNQRISWYAPRTLQTNSDGSTWTRTCSKVWVSRGVTLVDGTFVGLPADVISGPLKGRAHDPRFALATTPQERGPSVLRMVLPDWVNLDDLAFYQVTYTVLDNERCTDGYAGSTVKRISLPPPSQ